MKQIPLTNKPDDMAQRIKFEIVLMTPEWAKRLLAHPKNKNRTRRRSVVASFASACKGGAFVLTHQGVGVDPEGVLYDGQNRLAGIVDSGIPQWIVLATYSTADDALKAMMVIDMQARRTIGETLEIIGLVDGRGQDRVAVSRVMIAMNNGTNIVKQSQRDITGNVVENIEQYNAIRAYMPRVRFSAAHVAPFVWARPIHEQAIDALVSKLVKGEGLTTTEATLRLLLQQKNAGGVDGRLRYTLKVLRGIEACLNGEKLTRIPEQTRETIIARLSRKMPSTIMDQAAE